MSKYSEKILGRSELKTLSGSKISIDEQFYCLSGKLISLCNFGQSLIQRVVYSAYGSKVEKAGYRLKDTSSPGRRLSFLASYNAISSDKEVSKVFLFAKRLFTDIYELRNMLAHHKWLSSEDFLGKLILSDLDEEARLAFASERLNHVEGATSQQTYDAIMRYIESASTLSIDGIKSAINDIELCNWCFMQIEFILNETDQERLAHLKTALFIYEGVSHLFPDKQVRYRSMEWKRSRSKTVNI